VTSLEGRAGQLAPPVLVVGSRLESKVFRGGEMAGRELFRSGGSPSSLKEHTGCAYVPSNQAGLPMLNCTWDAGANLRDCPIMALAQLGRVTADRCRAVGCCYDQGRCFLNSRVSLPRCPGVASSSRQFLSFKASSKDGLVISDSAAASGLDGSFGLAVDVVLGSAGVSQRQLLFSTMPLDPVEVEKVNMAVSDAAFYEDLLLRTGYVCHGACRLGAWTR
jgi:hypothetical protein